MKIIYLLSARYPTEKAYGVTVGNTIKEFKEINENIEIVSWGSHVDDIFGNKIISLVKHPIRIPKFIYRLNSSTIRRTAFSINQMIFGIYLILKTDYRTKRNVYWTREPLTLVPQLILRRRYQYIIELHHPASKIIVFTIEMLSRRSKVVVIVLDKKSQEHHQRLLKDILIAVIPMGVPDSFFLQPKQKNFKPFVVGYIGKGMSSGNDNELYEIIYAARELNSKIEVEFLFIGLEPSYKRKMQEIIHENGLEVDDYTFIDHVSHTDIPHLLEKMSVGLLPYGDNAYNSERFPIKSLEYAAAGLPIIATDTQVHRDLLSSDFTFFYRKNDFTNLASQITQVQNISGTSESFWKSASTFAKKFTYDERVRMISAIIDENFG